MSSAVTSQMNIGKNPFSPKHTHKVQWKQSVYDCITFFLCFKIELKLQEGRAFLRGCVQSFDRSKAVVLMWSLLAVLVSDFR